MASFAIDRACSKVSPSVITPASAGHVTVYPPSNCSSNITLHVYSLLITDSVCFLMVVMILLFVRFPSTDEAWPAGGVKQAHKLRFVWSNSCGKLKKLAVPCPSHLSLVFLRAHLFGSLFLSLVLIRSVLLNLYELRYTTEPNWFFYDAAGFS